MSDTVKVDVSMLELEEHLFSQHSIKAMEQSVMETAAKVGVGSLPIDWRYCVGQLEEVLRLHRFFVFTWLMMNGVAIPVDLVKDQTHPRVGQQKVDQPAVRDE